MSVPTPSRAPFRPVRGGGISRVSGAELLWWAAGIALLASVVVRTVLFVELPALLTNDSWDFLRAADDLRHRLDFFSPGLRDVRLPGYPLFLALIAPLSSNHSDAIVAAQAVIGATSAAIGLLLGWLIGSPWVALLLAAFLGLNPVFLLDEHAIMSETLGLLFAVALVGLGVRILERGAWRGAAVLLGVLLAACTLTRANFLALGLTIILSTALAPNGRRLRRRADGSGERRLAQLHLTPALIATGVAALLIAPWVWRNEVAYGRASLYLFTNRNIIVYMNMHHRLDGASPALAAVNRAIGDDQISYAWLWKLNRLYQPVRAEDVAGEIVHEQIERHPATYVREVGDAFVTFLGFGSGYGNERTSVLSWFRELVAHVGRMQAGAMAGLGHLAPDVFHYDTRSEDPPLAPGFAVVGAAFLRAWRPAIVVVAALLLVVDIASRAARPGRFRADRLTAILALWFGFLASAAVHSIMLTDNDRYATTFDFVIVLASALVLEDLFPSGERSMRAESGSSAVSG